MTVRVERPAPEGVDLTTLRRRFDAPDVTAARAAAYETAGVYLIRTHVPNDWPGARYTCRHGLATINAEGKCFVEHEPARINAHYASEQDADPFRDWIDVGGEA